MEPNHDEIRARLFALQDKDYRAFHAKLVPTLDPACIIGVRTPKLRAFAKEVAGTPAAEAFLARLPHRYYEENNLHGFLIERMRDFDEAAAAADAFLPFVNNWATCDSLSPKAFAAHPERLLAKTEQWLESDAAFTVRFGIGMLMQHFLDDRFEPRFLGEVAGIKSHGWPEAPGTLPFQAMNGPSGEGGEAAGIASEHPADARRTHDDLHAHRRAFSKQGPQNECCPTARPAQANVEPSVRTEARSYDASDAIASEPQAATASGKATALPDASYYVNMMRAWYFATALAKQPDAALVFFEECRLDEWTHNKAIQKAVESRRIDADMKARLRALKRKGRR